MSQHRSVWSATADPLPFPPLAGDLTVDVAVVGGGIAGLTSALLLQRAGAGVAVIEAHRVAGGSTGGTTGKVTSQHGASYRELIDQHGEGKARLYAEANQQAVDVVARLADETGADCQFERAAAYVYTQDPRRRGDLEAEADAARGLGLPATFTTETDLPFPVQGAVRFDDQAHFHAVRYCQGLARAIADGGGTVVERTRALDVDERLGHVVVRTAEGEVRAGQAVIATLLPFVDLGGFFAKARPSRSYGLAAHVGGHVPVGMYISLESPTRSLRPWSDEGRPGVIVVGESHPTGHEDATPARWGRLEEWARAHLDVESFEYRWSAQDYTTADSVPYVGRSPRTTRTFVATGFRKWGLTNATAAAMVLADAVQGADHRWSHVFDATRVGDVGTIGKLVEENVHVGQRFVADRLGRLGAPSVDDLPPGEGRVAAADGDAVGAYRAPDGRVHAVGATCTHMGCTVRWNAAEASWDCPCHGSRFSTDGSVLNGPAVEPLPVVDIDAAGP